jgi:hypothetical protein
MDSRPLALVVRHRQIRCLRLKLQVKIEGIPETSKRTLEEINNPASADPLVRFALEKLQRDVVDRSESMSGRYYEEFGKEILREAIRLHGPDKGIEEAERFFGRNVADSPSKAAYHVYESLVGGWDKVQHFIRSATSEYKHGEIVTDVLQYGKELVLDELNSLISDDEGYSEADMVANNRGQAFGRELHQRYRPVRAQLRSPSYLFQKQVTERVNNVLREAESRIYRLYGVPR